MSDFNFDLDALRDKAREAAGMAGHYADRAVGAANTKLYIAQRQQDRKKLIAQAGELVYAAYTGHQDLPDSLFDVLRKVAAADRDIAEAQSR